jgi:polyhydroxyalkanoate synthesis regulator phasin
MKVENELRELRNLMSKIGVSKNSLLGEIGELERRVRDLLETNVWINEQKALFGNK